MSQIDFRNIRKAYGRVRVFEDISLSCPAQRYMCLLGPSGCGKTTLMRMVAGLVEPDAGQILIGERRVDGLAPWQRNIGLAFQNYALYPHLDVAGNLAFPLRAPHRRRRYGRADIEQRVREVARMLQIEPLLGRSVNQLSGGQQQRVALGRSLICEPSVLLLDEPIAHLDARLRYETRAELKQLHRRVGTTTIHVTHDQQEALAIADLVAVIRDGRLEQLGPPLELYDNPRSAFVASFIGDPPMSLLAATLAGDGLAAGLLVDGKVLPLPVRLARTAAAAPSGTVVVGLRPGDVALVEDSGDDVLPATVYSHENIGRQLELMLSVGGSLVRYRMERTRRVVVGERVTLRLSLDRARLFDAASGAALPAA
ncbi:MAG: ABC transporter ATP-binding protein [Geminicoccaceae bacterium]